MISHLPTFLSSDSAPLLGRLPGLAEWLPAAIAVVLGMLVGGAIWRQRGEGACSADAGSEEEGEVEGSEGDSISGIAGRHAAAATASNDIDFAKAKDQVRLVAELDQALASGERHRAESEASRSRNRSLDAQLAQQHEYVTALASAVEVALNDTLSLREKRIAAARAQCIRLAEALRFARQWVGAASDRFSTLHRRLEAAEERLWATTEETAGFRKHLDEREHPGVRPSGDRSGRLHQCVVEVNEQLRIYHQHLAGCSETVVTAREDLEPEWGQLRSASMGLQDAYGILEKLVDAEQATDIDVAAVQTHLQSARSSLSEVDAGAIEHASEVVERCEWVADDATHGLRSAVQRLGECESADEIHAAMMLNRSWRKLSEVGIRLDALKAHSESGSVGAFPVRSSVSLLLKQLDKVEEAVAEISAPEPSDIEPENGSPGEPPTDSFPRREVRKSPGTDAGGGVPRRLGAPYSLRSVSGRPPIRALHPGDFSRRLVGLSASLEDEPRALSDVSQVATSFGEAKADLNRLREAVRSGQVAALEAPPSRQPRGDSGAPRPEQLQAAFENTLLRSETQRDEAALPEVAPREDIKRLGDASKHLLSAVANKTRSSSSNGDPKGDRSVEGDSGSPGPAEPAVLATVETGEVSESEAAAPVADSAILFCGNDPSLWDRTVYRGQRHRALAIGDLQVEANFLRLRRLDTGDSVLVPISPGELSACSENPQTLGFHCGNDEYYGARHLGVFDERVPTDVEIRFTYGGWGFGHSNAVGSLLEERQCCGWAGKEVAADTVFEISVFRERPELLPGEVLLKK